MNYINLAEHIPPVQHEQCYFYKIYGITLTTNIKLNLLAIDEVEPQISIQLLDGENGDSKIIPGNIVYDFSPLAIVIFDQNQNCFVYPSQLAKSWQLTGLVQGLALQLALIPQGFCFLHGSSVCINGQGIGFVGASGSGKSTLAAYFKQAGFPVYSDDALGIKLINDNPFLLPGRNNLKLRPRTFKYLGHSCKSFSAADFKFASLEISDEEVDDRYIEAHKYDSSLSDKRLKSIYILEAGDQLTFTKLDTDAAFKALLPHVDSPILKYHAKYVFQHLKTLVSKVAVYQLRRPDKFECLQEILERVSSL